MTAISLFVDFNKSEYYSVRFVFKRNQTMTLKNKVMVIHDYQLMFASLCWADCFVLKEADLPTFALVIKLVPLGTTLWGDQDTARLKHTIQVYRK